MLLVLKRNRACCFNNSTYFVKSASKYFEEAIKNVFIENKLDKR